MAKRIFAILLTIQFLIFGGTSAWAGSPDDLESAQDIDISIGQEQTIDSDETADSSNKNRTMKLKTPRISLPTNLLWKGMLILMMKKAQMEAEDATVKNTSEPVDDPTRQINLTTT